MLARPSVKPLRFYLGGPRINKLPCGRWWSGTTGDQAKEQSRKYFVRTSTNIKPIQESKMNCINFFYGELVQGNIFSEKLYGFYSPEKEERERGKRKRKEKEKLDQVHLACQTQLRTS